MRRRVRPLAQCAGVADFRYAQIVGALEIQPRTRIATELSRQPHGRISRDAAPLTNHIIDPWCGYAECLCQCVGAHAKRLHVRRPLIGPAKAKTVLVIDPNTELPFSLTLQRFQPVARRRAQEFKGLRRIQLRQLPSCDFNNRRKSLALASFEQGSCIFENSKPDRRGTRQSVTIARPSQPACRLTADPALTTRAQGSDAGPAPRPTRHR